MATRQQDAGRLGGLQTLMRHGIEHYRQIGRKGGKLGGRPRRPTFSQIMAQRVAERKSQPPRLGFRKRSSPESVSTGRAGV